ncbi:MAG: DUF309 domain-containing protein [Chloroflexi bacterium]|nr:DUF309 domain-containing protein [Chloroflexota bacterium]
MAKEERARNQPLLTEEELEAQRPLLLQGVAQFNDGYFFEAHETWEDLWYPSPWPARVFLQGVIQAAAAFVHLMRHEYLGTVRLLDHALAKLDGFASPYLGLDAARFVSELRLAREELAALGPERFDEWDRNRIPRIHAG